MSDNGEANGNVVQADKNDFLLRCTGDSMYAMIRKVENECTKQCKNLVDGKCNSKCNDYAKCWLRQLRSVANDYETVRKGAFGNGEEK